VDIPDAVIDGELLCGSDQKTIYFVAFDAILVGSIYLSSEKLSFRIDSCRTLLAALNSQFQALCFNLKFIIQAYFPLNLVEEVLKKRDVPIYPTDGLVLIPADSPYAKGYSKQVMKLKDLKNSTLDFKVMGYCDEPFIVVLTTMKGIRFVHYDFSTLEEMRGKEGKIVECYWDPNCEISVPSRDFSYCDGGEKKW